MILDIEQLIVYQLKSSLHDFQVLPFPVKPEELGRAVPAKQIYVGFKGKKSERPDSVMVGGRVPIQKQQLEYELVVQMRELRSHQVLYPVLETIEHALVGYRPGLTFDEWVLTSAMYHVNSGFVDFNTGLWLYSMTFGVNAAFVGKNRPSNFFSQSS